MQTPLGVSSSTTVLTRVLFLTSSAVLTSSPIEVMAETVNTRHWVGLLPQRVEKKIGLDSLLSFVFM